MATVTGLRHAVRLMRRKVNPVPEPRHYVVELEEGEELSEALASQLHEHDSVTIRLYPRGYLDIDGASSGGQHMACWLRGKGGRMRPHVVRQYGVDISKV